MSIKTIAVSLNDVARLDVVLDVAAELAVQHGAHLCGIYVIPAVQVYPSIAISVTPEIYDAHKEFYSRREASVRQSFEDAVSRNGLAGEWQRREGASPWVADGLIDQAREADLVIIGQPDPEADSGLEADFAERVIMQCGRPVLVVPYAGTFRSVGRRIVVGWNATRESARAAFDALPFIVAAEETSLAWINPQAEREVAGDVPGAVLAASLARHGARVTAEAIPTAGLNAGEALLNRVADTGADMLVMGAYGHSRMREFVFGGATRHILQSMTVPVLLSH